MQSFMNRWYNPPFPSCDFLTCFILQAHRRDAMERGYTNRKKAGFTLAETMITVGIIGLLAAIAIPSFNRVRSRSRIKIMQSNVRLVNQAVEIWAMDTFTPENVLIGAEITNYLKGGIEGLAVGDNIPSLTNITQQAVGHTFTVSDLY